MPPALGAWSLNHWTTREVPITASFNKLTKENYFLLVFHILIFGVESNNKSKHLYLNLYLIFGPVM